MVFKKRAARRAVRYIRSKARRSGKSSSGMSVTNVLLAGAIYGAARPYAAKILPDMFSFGPVDSDNVIIGALGWYGMKKGTGLTKALGAVALGSEAGIVAARVSSGMLSGAAEAASNAYEY